MVDEYDGAEPMPPRTLTLKEGNQVSVVAADKTYRGTLSCDGERWFIKLATTGDEVVIARID
jgi:hypothetical protein